MPAGAYTAADLHPLITYSEDVALAQECSKAIAEDGIISEGSTGQLVKSPFVEMRTAAHLRLCQIGAKFGLDPTSGQAINIQTSSPKSEFDGLIN